MTIVVIGALRVNNIFLIFPENRILHSIQIVFTGNKLQGMSKPVLGKDK